MKIIVKYQYSSKKGDNLLISSCSTVLDIEHVSNRSINKEIEASLSSGEELLLIEKITAVKQNITVIEKNCEEDLVACKEMLRIAYNIINKVSVGQLGIGNIMAKNAIKRYLEKTKK